MSVKSEKRPLFRNWGENLSHTQVSKENMRNTYKSIITWKVSTYGGTSSPYFPAFAPEITRYLDTFHVVILQLLVWTLNWHWYQTNPLSNLLRTPKKLISMLRRIRMKAQSQSPAYHSLSERFSLPSSC